MLRYFLLLIGLAWSVSIMATHNRAGEITYRQLSPLSIEMTITTYTKASSVAADRDSLEVFWGDGTKEFVKRNNNLTRFEANDVKVNFYIATHTYPGVATYTISFLDPNRIGGILNVNYPNSIDIPFFLSTTFTLLDQQFQGFNNSAILLQPPLDIGCVGRLFIHNPNAFDLDGDSLAFELAVPLEDVNKPVPGYRFPNEIVAGLDNMLSINPSTGELRWQSPKLQGEYNIAIRIKEFRNGRLINTILRDMQILIRACENTPPFIESLDEICVVAGSRLEIPVKVSDPDLGQRVKLFATGGPFTVNSPAILEGPAFYTSVPFDTKIVWQTTCNHISNQYYQIVLRAVDNFYPDSTGLAFLKTIRIKVVGPAPENLQAKSESGGIRLEWNEPYSCEVTSNQYFRGFSVWRKIASHSMQHDTCSPGLTGSLYQKIVFRTAQKENGKYFYVDNSVEKGNTYCYRIQAEFARLTLTGNPFNIVESLHSNESCIQLSRDLPLITKVSVISTDRNNGTVHIRWTKPIPADLDTIVNPGPYVYELEKATGTGTFVSVPSSLIQSPYLNTTLDTNFFENSINTSESQFRYRIRFSAGNRLYGYSPTAGSVFLKPEPSDQKIQLRWSSEVPWSNYNYKIYRQNNSGTFQLIHQTPASQHLDSGLENSKNYCYRIESEGSYAIEGIETPLFNFSQIACATPLDNVAPCPPDARVMNVCDQLKNNPDLSGLFNTLEWDDPSSSCPQVSSDLDAYNIYYTEFVSSEFRKIATVSKSEVRRYFHFPPTGLSGCYYITSVDASGNESSPGNIACVDNCPFYELPNSFTPNNDSKNDVFRPRINLFIASVQFKVYNQWGNLVFETSDPSLNWEGTTQKGQILPDGTYFYTCKIFENRVSGIIEVPELRSGFIHIIRN